jgi:uncharacterized membrane protein
MSDRWKIILAVSLALNLFLLGAGVGVGVVGARLLGERVRQGGGGQRMTAAFQALPQDRRQALRDIMRTQAMDAAPDFRAARQAREEAVRLITTEPYDANAVAAALAKARDADARARGRIDATLASKLAGLSPQERAMFARILMRGPGRGGPRGPRGGGRPPPPPPPGGNGEGPPPPPDRP